MKRSILHRLVALMLTTALSFGQFGVSFFHNKHDAHESIVDLDHDVLVNHGEHCKVCAVDLAHEILAPGLSIQVLQTETITPVVFDYTSLTSFSQLLTKDRAPPFSV